MPRHLIPLYLLAFHARRVGKLLSHPNAFPLVLLAGGTAAAIYLGLQSLQLFLSGDLASEEPVLFAIACLVAVIGWRELTATDLHESDERGGF